MQCCNQAFITPKVESTGEMFRLMAGHKGGRVIACDTNDQALDILCTDHGAYLYVSAVNRSAEPRALHIKGYDIVECVTIQTKEYSFESNDFAVCKTKNADLHGHSVLFIKAVPCGQQ